MHIESAKQLKPGYSLVGYLPIAGQLPGGFGKVRNIDRRPVRKDSNGVEYIYVTIDTYDGLRITLPSTRLTS